MVGWPSSGKISIRMRCTAKMAQRATAISATMTVTGRRMARTVSHMLRILLNERVGADRERAEDRLGPWQIPTRNARPRVWQAHYQCSPAPATAGLRLLPRPLPVRLDTERVLVPRSVVLHPL